VSQDERGLVLHIQVAAELQRTVPLGPIDKDRNRHKYITQRQFMAGEDRAAGDRKPVTAPLALPAMFCRACVKLNAPAP
jgi:hypothetical protein